MEQQPQTIMGRRRALLTDSERELIAGEPDDESRRYQAVSRVRNKIEDELPEDVTILRENHTALYGELQEVVCPEMGDEADLRGRLQDALEARDDVKARADRLEEELADCQDLLDDAREQSVAVDLERVASALETASTALEGQNPDTDMAKSEIDGLLEGFE